MKQQCSAIGTGGGGRHACISKNVKQLLIPVAPSCSSCGSNTCQCVLQSDSNHTNSGGQLTLFFSLDMVFVTFYFLIIVCFSLVQIYHLRDHQGEISVHVALIPQNWYGNVSIMIQCWSKFNFVQCLIRVACHFFSRKKLCLYNR